jgi:hypothetical protein
MTDTWTAMVVRAYDHSRPAVRFDGLTWTGHELLDRAAGAADWLDGLGLAPGRPVPASSPPRPRRWPW